MAIPATATFLPEDHHHVVQLVRETCHALGCAPLGHRLSVRWSWGMLDNIGEALPDCVTFSAPIFALATIDERRNTIVHEVCHVVARHLYGPRDDPHDEQWRQLMLNCGEEPSVFHNVDITQFMHRHVAVAHQHHHR